MRSIVDGLSEKSLLIFKYPRHFYKNNFTSFYLNSSSRMCAALPAYDGTYSPRYVVPFDENRQKYQMSKGGMTPPRVLHNYRAFDAAEDEKRYAEVDKHAMHVATHQDAYENFQHLCWALSAGEQITEECERVRYVCTLEPPLPVLPDIRACTRKTRALR